jgi:hypothetical protein
MAVIEHSSRPRLHQEPAGLPLPVGEGHPVSHVQGHQLRVGRVRALGLDRQSTGTHARTALHSSLLDHRTKLAKLTHVSGKKTPRASRTCFVQFGEVIPMSVQLEHFSGVVDRMVKLSGQRKTAALLRKSIFFISTGSNDMFEYSASFRADDDDEAFLGALVDAYKHYIMVRTTYCSLQALVINRQILLRPARINSASAPSQPARSRCTKWARGSSASSASRRWGASRRRGCAG